MPVMTPTNEELLECYRQADFNAFNIFYKRHQRLLFNFLLVRLGNRVDAEEAFQETFVRLHKTIMKYDSTQNALGWTFTIARNIAVDLMRRRRRQGPTMATADIAVAGRDEVALAARQELERLLSSLASADQALLTSRFWAGESFDEIATHHGVTPANIRQRVSRLLKKLKTSHS